LKKNATIMSSNEREKTDADSVNKYDSMLSNERVVELSSIESESVD